MAPQVDADPAVRGRHQHHAHDEGGRQDNVVNKMEFRVSVTVLNGARDAGDVGKACGERLAADQHGVGRGQHQGDPAADQQRDPGVLRGVPQHGAGRPHGAHGLAPVQGHGDQHTGRQHDQEASDRPDALAAPGGREGEVEADLHHVDR